MGSGGGMVRSQGRMPTQVAFETPSSWNPQTPGPQGTQVFRMHEETTDFNLFGFDEDLAHQTSCAGIPQVDLLGPLGGEGHRGKGQGGTTKENGKVMHFVLKDLYGKIKVEEKGILLDNGNIL